MKTALVTVVSGAVYEHFSDQLFASAEEFFHPTDEVEFYMVQGRSGWPEATMYRHHFLYDNMPDADYVFLTDADMLFEGEVGSEILPTKDSTRLQIAATLHPGYVGAPPDLLPYERREDSYCAIPIDGGKYYFCGGFWGGTRQGVIQLAAATSTVIDLDVEQEITPIWHDESALNWFLDKNPPQIRLSPSYCYPDNAVYYKGLWGGDFDRKLVALDKTTEQRVARG